MFEFWTDHLTLSGVPLAKAPEESNELELFIITPSERVSKTRDSAFVAPLKLVVVLPDT